MLFNKYQYHQDDILKRGYSQSCQAIDGNGKPYWVKWILGIEKSDVKAKILSDKLRHLQKARHNALPDIVDYGYDEEQKAFAIVYELLLSVDSFENRVYDFKTQSALAGLIDLADCLSQLHSNYQITHGDIHPGNILIDENGQFYLIDFGLADITRTLSQLKEIEVFTAGFAAPEKLSRLRGAGFPFQADVFSFGKVIDWMFHEKGDILSEEQSLFIQRMLATNPAERPTWLQVAEFVKTLAESAESEVVHVAFRKGGYENSVMQGLNSSQPVFSIYPSEGANYLLDIIVGEFYCEKVLWLKDEDKLLFNEIKFTESVDKIQLDRRTKEGKRLPFKFKYSNSYPSRKADLTPYFQKWFELSKKSISLRENRKAVREELGFYKELLEEELKVISRNALRLQYSGFHVNGDEIEFQIRTNEKYSSPGFIQKHVEDGNAVNSEGFEYEVSGQADRKQNKKKVLFAGKPYDFDTENRILKIKDCERLDKDRIPQSGFLFESTAMKEEEKNRQLEAMRKVERNEVQNPDLIYFLFKPDELNAPYIEYPEQLNIHQKDSMNRPFVYSANQQTAIQNALYRKPLSVIQGPPGTGKTTVITEIVFQILSSNPESKVLITSQTNNAVDQVLENLLKSGIPILRLSGITKPRNTSIRKHTLDRKLEGWKQQVRERSEKNFSALKSRFLNELKEKNPIASNVAEIILEIPDWKKAKLKIEGVIGRISTYRELHSLPVDKNEAIQKLDKILNSKIADFLALEALHRDWVVTINSLDEKSAINQKLVDSIRVIGATCNHIAARKYSKYNFEFDYVIMDESGKATTAEALVPIVTGKNLVYVGDQRQLRPKLTSTREVEKWLREKYKKEAGELESWDDYFNRPSLFEQVISAIDTDYKAQLTQCRRSSADQVRLTSKWFYEHVGDEPIESVSRESSEEHNLPLAIISSIFFIDIGSHVQNLKDDNGSSFNNESARIIPEILELLNKYPKIQDYSVGVITGYTAQFRKLKRNIDKKKYTKRIESITRWKKQTQEEKLTVSVVDSFQGLERDVIIVDLVKGGANLNLGFLEVPNRINVALSRQKKLLIIVGDYHGIINAKTKKDGGKKVALQHYLESLKPEWVVKADRIEQLFR